MRKLLCMYFKCMNGKILNADTSPVYSRVQADSLNYTKR